MKVKLRTAKFVRGVDAVLLAVNVACGILAAEDGEYALASFNFFTGAVICWYIYDITQAIEKTKRDE